MTTSDARARVDDLARRHSTASVLFHHAVAERLGLGPSDHKCLDLLRERGPMTGSELAAVTGLTTGGVTGVTARLERAGYVEREPHPHDGRKQLLRPTEGALREIGALFAAVARDAAALTDGFDDAELAAITEYLARATRSAQQRAALLRADPVVLEPR